MKNPTEKKQKSFEEIQTYMNVLFLMKTKHGYMQVSATLFRLISYHDVTFIKLTEELLIIPRLLRGPGPRPAAPRSTLALCPARAGGAGPVPARPPPAPR